MTSRPPPALTLIVPAYNEAGALRAGKLARLRAWLDEQPFEGEVLVVDDGSTDATARLAAVDADRVLTIAHAGKAAAVVAGIEAARGERVLFTDMDQATPIEQAAGLLAALDAGADVAVGCRGLARDGAPLGRLIMSWGQVALRTALLGLTLKDTQCGFKAFRREAALDVLGRLHVYHPDRLHPIHGPSVTSGFDVEVLVVARLAGYVVRPVSVNWHYEETRRVDLRRDSWRGVRDLAAIAAARWRGAYRVAPATAAAPFAAAAHRARPALQVEPADP